MSYTQFVWEVGAKLQPCHNRILVYEQLCYNEVAVYVQYDPIKCVIIVLLCISPTLRYFKK